MDGPTAGRFEGAEHRLPVRVYYEDTDFTGVVYHANYARYFERGRSDFLRLAGLDHTALLGLAPPLAFTVARLSLEFRRPARIDDALEVRTRFDSARGARFAIRQHLWRGDEMLCAAEVQAACVDLTGRPPPAARGVGGQAETLPVGRRLSLARHSFVTRSDSGPNTAAI